jgi:hypothetical protein
LGLTEEDDPSRVSIDISSDPKILEEQAILMERYMKDVRESRHESLEGTLESDSFLPQWKVPKCYDMPKIRETLMTGKESSLILSQRFKQFPDKVLFYIFYS